MASSQRLNCPLKDRLAWILESRKNIFGYFHDQFLTPEWIANVVVDYANVLKVERNILLVGGNEYDWLLEGMCQPKFIKDVGISSGQLGHEHFRGGDPGPYLIYDFSSCEDLRCYIKDVFKLLLAAQ